MSVFVESVDVDAAWEVYYQLADRRHKEGLTIDQLRQVIDAALVGVVEAEEDKIGHLVPDPLTGLVAGFRYTGHRFVSPWVEVDEHPSRF